jgi:hypothetical protein
VPAISAISSSASFCVVLIVRPVAPDSSQARKRSRMRSCSLLLQSPTFSYSEQAFTFRCLFSATACYADGRAVHVTDERLLTLHEVAERLRLHRETVSRWPTTSRYMGTSSAVTSDRQ